MAENPLKRDYEWYIAHEAELFKKYGPQVLHNGKWIAIKGQLVIGIYDIEPIAVSMTSGAHEPGTFLICLPKPSTTAWVRTQLATRDWSE